VTRGPTHAAVAVGDALPDLALPALTRTTIALYAAGSGDHVPLHIDSDFARAAGYPDVFMHGALGMAYVGRLLEQWVGPEAVLELDLRFRAITYPGEQLTATGRVTEKLDQGQVKIAVKLANPEGQAKLSGHARIALP
jgi:acyl dehydratase